MGKRLKTACFFLGLCFFSTKLFSQEAEDTAGTIPEALRRPEWGETARYPHDLVIGELGQGDAPEGAYRFAQDLLEVLAAGSTGAPVLTDSLSVLTEDLVEEINSIAPRTCRLGGGRTEADGSVSFLVRFLGRTESLTGELFLRQAEEKWLFDSLILEEKKNLAGIKDSYSYDFSPYERFF